MEPGPGPRSIVSAELPTDPPPEEVTEQWSSVAVLADDDTDPVGFPPVDPAGEPYPGDAPDGAETYLDDAPAGVDPWPDETYDTDSVAEAVSYDEEGAASPPAVYVGEDPGWAVPHDAAENPYGDEEWAVSPESGRAAFVGEASTEGAGVEPGWPAGPDAPPSTPKPPGRKIGLALLVVSLLGAGAIVTAGFIDSPGDGGQSPVAAVPGANPPQGRGVSAVLTAPLDGLANATFDLADSANSVRLHAADLGGDLYRISAPAGSGLLPRVVRSGAEVRLYLSHAAQPGTGVVDVAVNSTVGWRLQLDAGVAQTVLDMGAGKVDGIDLAGGASRIELILPKPQGQVAVRMTGGVDQFLVRLAKLTPVRVRADSGAGQVTVGGSTHHGIAAGQSFTANGWGEDAPGVDVQAVAGMSALTVTES